MIRAYLHRGAHRANRFSVRVADVQAALAVETLQASIIDLDGAPHLQLWALGRPVGEPMPLSVGAPGVGDG